MKTTKFGLLLICLLSLFSLIQAQNAMIQGTVTDASNGDPLISANIRLVTPGTDDLITGTATDVNGQYSFTAKSGTYELVASFIGYENQRKSITLSSGITTVIDFMLSPEGFGLDMVVVSASRQAEKILDAPASVSVLDVKEIEKEVNPSAAAMLRNVEGVDMAQTGVDRYEVVLRGFNNAFSGAAYTLVDYRQAAIASLGVNAYTMMPIASIDLERVEVVRGPGSALYGPGVDAGVVHFITKNPFDHPGTTVSVGGGEQSTLVASFRHAGVSGNGKLGYKLGANFSQATEFGMDVMNVADFTQLDSNGDNFVVMDDNGTLTAYQVNNGTVSQTNAFSQEVLKGMRDVPRETEAGKKNVHGMLEYKVNNKTSVIANAGYSVASGPFLSGIGNLYARDFGYTYGQLRLQSGNFFATASLNQNNHGESYVIGNRTLNADGSVNNPGTVYDKSKKWNIQAQYNQNASANLRLIYGVDYELTVPDTGGTIYGRNEENDQITEYGAYIQGQYAISPKLDLTLAGRGDYNNIVDDFQLSPRVALVYKPKNGHSFRATFNSAFSSPGNNSLFLDIPAAQSGPLTVYGRGSAFGYTFDRTCGGSAYGGLCATGILSSNLGVKGPVGLDFGDLWGHIYNGINADQATFISVVTQQLGIDAQTAAGLLALLDPQLTQVAGFADALLVMPSTDSTAPLDIRSNVIDIEPLKQTTTQTWEIGYKGIFSDKVLFAVDAYYLTKKNFVGPLLFETPVAVPASFNVNNFTAALATAMANNPQLAGALGLLGVTPAQAAGLLINVLNADGSLTGLSGTPVAVISPLENDNGAGAYPDLMLAYRNFGEVSMYGVDTAIRYLASENLSLFGNFSWVNDNYFDASETKSNLPISLNAPKIKVKVGGEYAQPKGFSAGASLRYNDGFSVTSGPYIGTVEAYSLIDLALGYDFSNSIDGLRFDVQVQNVADNKVRQFVGAPAVGRYTTARLTFSF